MSMTRICTIPTTITAGDTLRFAVMYPAYHPDAWTAELLVRGESSEDVAGVQSEDDPRAFVFEVGASVTAEWAAGTYRATVRVSDGTDVVTLESRRLTVLADPGSSTAGASLAHAERMLAAIEATLEGRATTDQQRYRIGDRELERIPIAELLKMRGMYREEVRRLNACAGARGYGRTIKVVI